ncbi:MAG TPA: DUF4124 domain-containing protein [Burkholderiales bacterium]|nr:DUF4124 domain-containing protein [Burkholderiales bacterium]
MIRTRLACSVLLAASALLSPAAADAGVLRCTDGAGKTLYTDSACPAGMHAVGTSIAAAACATPECERRRELDLEQANARLRADKEELAAMTAARQQREMEERRLDEQRYEAQLRSAAMLPEPANDAVYYPAYPGVVYPALCRGPLCFNDRHHHRPVAGVKAGDPGNRHNGRFAMRIPGNEPKSAIRGTAARPGMTIDGASARIR